MTLLVNGVPIDAGEEGMSLDLCGAARDVAEAAGAVDGAELANDILCCVADGRILGEDDWLFDDPARRVRRPEKKSSRSRQETEERGTYCL